MSILTDRITEVTVATMRIHRPRRLHGEPQMEECQAGCKYPPGSSYGHIAAHVAQQIVEALYLTEEHGWVRTDRTDGHNDFQHAIVGWMPRQSETP